MREPGWTEWGNLLFDERFDDGREDLLPQLAAELVQLTVDVLVACGAGREQVTSSISIVANAAWPVESGLTARLARPGERHGGDMDGAQAVLQGAAASDRP